MKTEQMPERISITTPSDMTQVDYSLFWVSPPCPGGEHAVKSTGHDYAEYVRADAAHWDVPKIEVGCWTNTCGLSMSNVLKVLVAYGYSGGWLDIKALATEGAKIVRKTPNGTIITQVKGAAEDRVDADAIIAALPQLLAS